MRNVGCWLCVKCCVGRLHYKAQWHEPRTRVPIKYVQDRQCTYDVALRRVYETILAVEQKYVLHVSVCVCGGGGARVCGCARLALLTQNATQTRHIVILSRSHLSSFLAPQHFWTSFHKRHDFWKNVMYIKCLFRFSVQRFFETSLILRIIQWVVVNVKSSLCKVRVIFVGI